jgi:hypothetical protein
MKSDNKVDDGWDWTHGSILNGFMSYLMGTKYSVGELAKPPHAPSFKVTDP